MAETPLRSQKLSNGAKAAVERVLANGTPSHPTSSTWTPSCWYHPGSGKVSEENTNCNSAWTTKPIKQDVVYDDREAVEKALAKLERLPPLVTPTEVRTSLAERWVSETNVAIDRKAEEELERCGVGQGFSATGRFVHHK